MYKYVALLAREEGLSHESFLDRWEDTHESLTEHVEGVVRYATAVPVDADASEFDGLAELYFETLDGLDAALGGDGGRDDPVRVAARRSDEGGDGFLPEAETPRFVGEEVLRKDETDGDTTGLYKHSAFLVRKDGLSYDDFLDHWLTEHVPIAREIPGVVRYATVIPNDPSDGEFDGLAELYFEDVDALRAALGHESSRDYDPDHPKAEAAREDVDDFLAVEDRPRFVGQETVHEDVRAEHERGSPP